MNKSTKEAFDSKRTEVKTQVGSSIYDELINIKGSIINRDLNIEMESYFNQKDIIAKISTFNIDKCGKYINITRDFLCDISFLKYADCLIKNNNCICSEVAGEKRLSDVGESWFERIGDLLKRSQYKFRPARQVEVLKENNIKRVFLITNRQDRVIQKAIALILEMIYERDGVFLDVSHGFRKQRSFHTALQQIKETWTGTPFYLEAVINKAFDNVNYDVLINLLKQKISDKRLCDLIAQMYKVNILCPEGFWLKNNRGIMQGNILSPILCNIYLHELDLYIMKEVAGRFEVGDKLVINQMYKNICLKERGKRSLHLQEKIYASRRKCVAKVDIPRILKGVSFVRIRYIRYADNFIIGIRGSISIAQKIKGLVHKFLSSVLHLQLNMAKTKIINTYIGEKAQFLDMLIYNKETPNFSYRNSRAIENQKRVKNKNIIFKKAKFIKITKKNRQNFIK